MKTNKNIFLNLLSVFLALAIFFDWGLPVCAQTSGFPKEEAGLAVYGKLEALDEENFDNFKEFLSEHAETDYLETATTTYMIAIKRYAVNDGQYEGSNAEIDLHIYLGVDGWLAVYLLNNEVPGSVVSWRAGENVGRTILESAFDEAATAVGADIVEQMKYYDFSHTQATKMSIARQKLSATDEDYKTDLSTVMNVIVPGQLYQASYSIKNYAPESVANGVHAVLNLNGNEVANFAPSGFEYGVYNDSLFNPAGSNNQIILLRGLGIRHVSAASVFIYHPAETDAI